MNWNVVEDRLKEYIEECAEITETSDAVYDDKELVKYMNDEMKR